MHCTKCGTAVPKDARFCGGCGAPVEKGTKSSAPLSGTDVRRVSPARAPSASENAGGVIGGLVIIAIAIFAFRSCTSESPEEKAAAEKERVELAAKTEEDRRNGFHCLSAWDGSSTHLERLVKARLRDPDSFEHEETRITPVKDGKHAILMRYRAKNGFGGYNQGVAMGSINHNSCAATLIANE